MINPVAIVTLLAAMQAQPVAGPLTEALERRVDKLTERIEAWRDGSSLAIEKLEQVQSSRFTEMFQALADARNERQTILENIREIRLERDGVFSEIAQFRRDRDGRCAGFQAMREEIRASVGRWTPLQNLMDRLIGLVWKILWLFLSLAVVLVVIASVGLYLYVKLRAKVFSLVQGELP